MYILKPISNSIQCFEGEVKNIRVHQQEGKNISDGLYAQTIRELVCLFYPCSGHRGDAGLVTQEELLHLLKTVELFVTNP